MTRTEAFIEARRARLLTGQRGLLVLRVLHVRDERRAPPGMSTLSSASITCW